MQSLLPRAPRFRPRVHQARYNSSSPSPQLQKKASETLAKAEKGAEQAWETGKKYADQYAGPAQEQAAKLWETTKKYSGPAGETAVKAWEAGVKAAGPTGKKVNSVVDSASFSLFPKIDTSS